MANKILTATLIVLFNVCLIGCNGIDVGRGQIKPIRTGQLPKSEVVIKVPAAEETDIVEQMATNRLAYRQGLEALALYYDKTGNIMKVRWAQKELRALNTMPQYNYIIQANIAGPDLKARESIAEADLLYIEAVATENRANRWIVVRDKELLRTALDKYNQLLRKYPSSDKVGDAAYKAGQIYQYFKDYSIALLYYQRAYQWDPKILYPAEYKAAYILDQHLRRRTEALELYQRAIEKGGLLEKREEFVQRRIKDLTTSR